ncbi:MAG: ASKHA domain-containing protein [Bacillota bacterium]
MPFSSTLEIESPKGHHVIQIPGDAQQRRLTEVLRRAGLPLNARCGERQLCDGCMVELVSGSLTHVGSGKIVTANGTPILLRGCEYRIEAAQSVKLRLAARSLLAYEPLVVTVFSVNVRYAHNPLYQCIPLRWNGGGTREAIGRAIAEQFAEAKRIEFSPEAEKAIAGVPPEGEFFATIERRATGWVASRLSSHRVEKPVGVAIDIGTTTVAVLLVDLRDGRVLAEAAGFNQQMNFGDDVVTRITLCSSKPEMVRQLQEAVAHRTIDPLLAEAMTKAGVTREQLVCFTIAGNTTMMHLVSGVDPSPMGIAPFTPMFVEYRVMTPGEVFGRAESESPWALPCPPTAAIHLLPSAAAYIGSDLTAGVVASGLLYDEGPSLLVDVGTNGEIILKHGDQLMGCATAAGPAFEGAGLSCGIRAGDGAISRIRLDASPFAVHTEMIGAEKRIRPAGICGSAYVDFLAQARRTGLLAPAGRFERSLALDSDDRLIPWNGNDLAFRLAHADHAKQIVISQTDIARLLQAKAAVAAGILILLKQAGLEVAQIRRLYLAGGFGTHMDVNNAIACGLLPGFKAEQVQSVGNTSLGGAYVALMDSTVLDEMSRIGKRLKVIELNLDPDFETTYIDQLLLPDVG